MNQLKLLLASSHAIAAEFADKNEILFWHFVKDAMDLRGKKLSVDNFIVVDYENLSNKQMDLLMLAKERMLR